MNGQIDIKDKAGEFIYKITSNCCVNSIVEVGTWNGRGSTQCVIQGLKNKKSFSFFTVECDKFQYELALEVKPNLSDVHFLFGSIIDYNRDLSIENLGSFDPREREWLDLDIKCLKEAPNVLNLLPNEIDFLILDGGEFSTRAEMLLLKDRSNIIMLDDTKCRKNNQNRLDLLSDDGFDKIFDDLDYRRGLSIFKRASFCKGLTL